jgi:hypothetical protein
MILEVSIYAPAENRPPLKFTTNLGARLGLQGLSLAAFTLPILCLKDCMSAKVDRRELYLNMKFEQ